MEAIKGAYDYSDPHFKIFKVPEWRASIYKFLAVDFWGNVPGNIQRRVSSYYSSIYSLPFTKRIIKPYVKFYYQDADYLSKFNPPEGKNDFESFQDFFIRRFKSIPDSKSNWVWPCEGLLCDLSYVSDQKTSSVKADRRNIWTIFGVSKDSIPREYSFTNVFLHNKNYHRIHAPVDGKISRIQHIPGDLVILRPWIYKQNPSLPAFRNERYNIDIVDVNGKTWYLSIVGGPAVGSIKLPKDIKVGHEIKKLSEIAVFYLGSTCCMAAPIPPRYHRINTFVEVGAIY